MLIFIKKQYLSVVIKIKKIKMDKFKELKSLLEAAEADASAFFEKGNKAAGTRLRNAMQQTKVLAQDIRGQVTAKKNEG